MTINRAAIDQIVLLSSLLTGFSLTAILQLLSIKDTKKDKVLSVAIVAFSLSTSVLLIATIVGSMMLIRVDMWNNSFGSSGIDYVGKFTNIISTLFFIGSFICFIGLGSLGWLKSKQLGWIISITATISFLISWVIVRQLP